MSIKAVNGGTATESGTVTGVIAEGESVVITDSGFGTGPTIANIMFENFENGTLGSDITAANTEFDAVNSATYLGKRDSDSRSGSFSNAFFQSLSDGGTDFAQCTLIKNITATEVFVSYAHKVPSGTLFPWRTTEPASEAFPTGSSWKACWLQGSGGSSDNDVVMQTYVTGWFTGGNDANISVSHGLGATMFSFSGWNRVSNWIKCGADPDVDNGTHWVESLMADGTRFTESTTDQVIMTVGSSQEWATVEIPGWVYPHTNRDSIDPLLDDVYICSGANAAARVELGDNAVFASCTDRSICEVTAWAAGEITCTIHTGAFGSTPTGDKWLYVIDATNTVVATYKVL